MASGNGIYDSALDLIGNTPLVRLNRINHVAGVDLLGKLESDNPGGSVKDRVGLSMILDAEQQGLLKPGGTIVEPTSGNTGLGLSMVAAVRGYKVILVMPDNMSSERRVLLTSYGAELVLTPGMLGMAGAVQKAEDILAEHPDYFMPQQFKNPANVEIHRKTTAEEIWAATDGKIDAFVAAVGTGGTLTGVGQYLKEKDESIRVIAVEPSLSPVISGKPVESLVHAIQGIGAGFIPDILDRSIIDDVMLIDDEEAYQTARRMGLEEGLLVGISAGANVCAGLKLAEDMGEGRIVTILCDTGERYLSIREYFEGQSD
ncbi:MAG: cysteine synthase A [candidate division Zixibacteria bacterium]|nr:cysteine synthase A [candidate division Zixibacteria bacterium]